MRKKSAPRARPILFSGEMVRALLSGRKTQTRRPVKWLEAFEQPILTYSENGHSGPGYYIHEEEYPEEGSRFEPCPFGKPGDRLWVRETHKRTCEGKSAAVQYRADMWTRPGLGTIDPLDHWRPSIHMPSWAARILLEITDVRIERLHDINEQDATREGSNFEIRHFQIFGMSGEELRKYRDQIARRAFQDIWESTGGNWAENPWVWVISFKMLEGESAL